VILNAKTDKISGCNALDKVLVDKGSLPNYEERLKELQDLMKKNQVEILVDEEVSKVLSNEEKIPEEDTWYEEFLAMKIVIGSVENMEEAIEKINKYSGGHSASIITTQKG
jgi:glutamate-5-semialdehyde dehydrogenase